MLKDEKMSPETVRQATRACELVLEGQIDEARELIRQLSPGQAGALRRFLKQNEAA